MSSNPVHGEMNSIQHYVIKFVSDLQQFSGFLHFPALIQLTVKKKNNREFLSIISIKNINF